MIELNTKTIMIIVGVLLAIPLLLFLIIKKPFLVIAVLVITGLALFATFEKKYL